MSSEKITITESNEVLTVYNDVKQETVGTIARVVQGVDVGQEIETLLQVLNTQCPSANVSDTIRITLAGGGR